MKKLICPLIITVVCILIYHIFFCQNQNINDKIEKVERIVAKNNKIVSENNKIVKENNKIIKDNNLKIDTLISLNKEILEFEKSNEKTNKSVKNGIDRILDWFNF